MTFWSAYNSQWHEIMTRDEVRSLDAWAMDVLQIPGTVLMENAGRSAAEIAVQMLSAIPRRRVRIFCGAGNNGGDGFVVARHLTNCQINAQIILCAPLEKMTPDAKTHLEICRRMNIPIQTLELSEAAIRRQVRTDCSDCGLIIDALFGTGLKGELSSPYPDLINCLNSLNIPILAIDIPSGLDCDLGVPLPVCIQASATVSFAAAKPGFFKTPQAARATGTLYIASIGIDAKKARN